MVKHVVYHKNITSGLRDTSLDPKFQVCTHLISRILRLTVSTISLFLRYGSDSLQLLIQVDYGPIGLESCHESTYAHVGVCRLLELSCSRILVLELEKYFQTQTYIFTGAIPAAPAC
jgi:hypothetical protein